MAEMTRSYTFPSFVEIEVQNSAQLVRFRTERRKNDHESADYLRPSLNQVGLEENRPQTGFYGNRDGYMQKVVDRGVYRRG